MKVGFMPHRNRVDTGKFRWTGFVRWLVLVLFLTAWLAVACTRLVPPETPPDLPAQRLLADMRQTNTDLTRFKCVAKITLSEPNQPARSFRTAMAGQLPDHLRIELIAPFGGSAGTVSADGKHLYLVMPPSHEYYKRRFGKGSLRRLIQMDLNVGDLLELLVGRIPLVAESEARLVSDETGTGVDLVLVDRRGRARQRIAVDGAGKPVRSQWFDGNQHPTRTLTIVGRQTIDGFELAKRIELSAVTGQQITVVLGRYEANARFDEGLFVIAPPSS